MSEARAIEIRGLTKRYKNGVTANDGIDLDVSPGTVFGLLGPNGAGKTTLIRQLTGELLPTSGSLRVLGVDVIKEPLRAKALMGIVPQEVNTFDVLSTEDHITAFGRLHGLSWSRAKERTEELMDEFGLLPHRKKQTWHLSGGLRRKVLVAGAMTAEPPLMVLDEPTTGLDPHSRREVWESVSAARMRGATVLLTTHYMEEAEFLCSEVAIIGRGRILARGTVAEVRMRCRHQYRATYDERGESQVIYGESQPALIARLESLGIFEYAMSKTTLEDVYLELTQERIDEPVNV